jgi:predicted secreted protein
MKRLNETFNTASVKKGEKFEICLRAASGAGFLWEVHVASGKAELLSEKHSNLDPKSDSVGGDTIQHFVFKAKESGTIKINALYKRSWLTQPGRAESFKIKVR